eukprot:scaffold19779_cov62-Phaeocystis_antarctica.AAC.3
MRKRVVRCRRQHGHSRRLVANALKQLAADQGGGSRGLHLSVAEYWTRWLVKRKGGPRASDTTDA